MKRKIFFIISALFLLAIIASCGKKENVTDKGQKNKSSAGTSISKDVKEVKGKEVTEKEILKSLTDSEKKQWKEADTEDKEFALAVATYEKTIEVYITDIDKKYVGKDGYVKPEDKDKYIDELYDELCKLKDQGLAKKVTKNKNNVALISSEGMLYFYCPEIEGKASGAGKLVSYDPWGWAEYWKQKYVYLDEALEVLRFTQNEIIPSDKGMDTIDAIKSISTDGLLLWMSHGTYDTEAGTCLTTGIKSSLILDFKLKDDMSNRRIGKVKAGDIYGYVLAPSFFERHLEAGSLSGAVVYLGACESGRDDRLANVFLNKGADTVLGFTEDTYIGYIVKMAEAIFSDATFVKRNGTYHWPGIGEAVYHAKEKYGDHENLDFVPELAELATERDSYIKIFGNTNKEMIGSKSLEITVVNPEGEPVEGLCRFQDNRTGEHLFDIYSTKEKTGNLTVSLPDIDYYISVDADTYKIANVPPKDTDKFDIVLERDLDRSFAGGKGTKDDPYQIATTDHFKNLAAISNEGIDIKDKYFVLTGNIGAREEEIVINSFKGHFDGGGHSIATVKQNKSLFNRIESAEIKNLSISASTISYTGADAVGGIVGTAKNSVIENCCFDLTGVVSASSKGYVGGICGYAIDSNIINCVNKGKIWAEPKENHIYYDDISNGFYEAPTYCAGIVGKAENSKISGCVNASENVGVAICSRAEKTTFSGCVNEAIMKIPLRRAGLCGVLCNEASDSTFSKCINEGDIWVHSHIPFDEYAASADMGVGAIVGQYSNCTLEGCENKGGGGYNYLHIEKTRHGELQVVSFIDYIAGQRGLNKALKDEDSEKEKYTIEITGLPENFNARTKDKGVSFVVTVLVSGDEVSKETMQEICNSVEVRNAGNLGVSCEAEVFSEGVIMVYLNLSWTEESIYTFDFFAGNKMTMCNISVND